MTYPANLKLKTLKNRSYGKLAGGQSIKYDSTIVFTFTNLPPKALRSFKRNKLWWAVEFDCENLGDHEKLRNKIAVWIDDNCQAGTTHLPHHTNYAGFRKEEDALMCYMAFC